MGSVAKAGLRAPRKRSESQLRRKLPLAEELGELLDRVELTLRESAGEQLELGSVLDELVWTLRTHKLTQSESEWQRTIERCRQHSVMRALHEDPFTGRAYQKPRGYAGDAVMMDYIYGPEEGRPTPPATALGRAIFEHFTNAPASLGVRSRRALIATHIDRLVEERPGAHVLAIAAGHLREASLSIAIRRRRTGRVVALDADAESLEEVRASYGAYGVETRTASFRELLTGGARDGEFDLIYSTGLFDYLPARAGRRLVAAMHRMLRPGGSLLVANFLPGIRDVGYMEAFMDWNLVYRSRQDMIDLTHALPEAEVKNVQLWSEEALNIIFLRVTRQ